MDSRYKVLHVSRYDFKDENDRTIKGCKVSAIGQAVSEDNQKGCPIMTFSAPYEIWAKFNNLPGDYDLNLTQKVSKGRVTLALQDAAPAQK